MSKFIIFSTAVSLDVSSLSRDDLLRLKDMVDNRLAEMDKVRHMDDIDRADYFRIQTYHNGKIPTTKLYRDIFGGTLIAAHKYIDSLA